MRYLIDRDKELEQLKKNVHGVLFTNLGTNGYGTILVPFEEIEKVIADQPTIEIVRCSDCKWWDSTPDHTMLPDWHRCRLGGERMHTRYEDFCSRGERRTDDN